jgi:sugar lactone lactonase YvrE
MKIFNAMSMNSVYQEKYQKEHVTTFPIEEKKIGFTTASAESLKDLRTTVRKYINGNDTKVPDGYTVEPVMTGLSLPTDLTFAPDGTLFVSEGGSSWPTRPYMPARVIRVKPNGEVDTIQMDIQAGPRGIAYRDGELYMAIKGGYFTRIVKYNLETKKLTTLIDQLPNGGWHEPGGPIFGPDGLMYFGQGSVSQQGVVLPQGFTVDIAKHPLAHDVPGQDITLTGNNCWSRDPIAPYPYLVETGGFKPFKTPAKKGEQIKGELFCSSGVWRSKPDGTDVELLAWGVRNPFGMAMNSEGELYVADNDFEEKSARAIAEDPDRIWHIKIAKQPYGSIKTPDWYGFPDICGDGLPVNHESHLPLKGEPALPIIENPPQWAGPAAYLEKPHSCMCKMDFCTSDAFGFKGESFATEWGTLAPLNTPRKEALTHGFKVIRLNTKTGKAEDFFTNHQPGPASYYGTGGLERPVSCKFHPDGKSLYVLDFGTVRVTTGYMLAFAHTGVIWKITKQ